MATHIYGEKSINCAKTKPSSSPTLNTGLTVWFLKLGVLLTRCPLDLLLLKPCPFDDLGRLTGSAGKAFRESRTSVR